MDITHLECPKCGAPMTETNERVSCPYCGHEAVLESKKVNRIGEQVSSSIQSTGQNTQMELKRLQLTQELSALQMQLSNIRSEKRSLSLVERKTRQHVQQLNEIAEEERQVTARIQLLQETLYPQAAAARASQPLPGMAAAAPGEKSQGAALALAFFLGYFGAHRFYSGHNTLGWVYLFTLGGFGLGYFIDLILILTGVYKDAWGRKLRPMHPGVFKALMTLFLGAFLSNCILMASNEVNGFTIFGGYALAILILYGKSIFLAVKRLIVNL